MLIKMFWFVHILDEPYVIRGYCALWILVIGLSLAYSSDVLFFLFEFVAVSLNLLHHLDDVVIGHCRALGPSTVLS
jgi:hypothetical protein